MLLKTIQRRWTWNANINSGSRWIRSRISIWFANVRFHFNSLRWTDDLLANWIIFKAVCSQPCQNGGSCTKPNTCSCPSQFEGALCQETKGCKTKPSTQNAIAACTLDDCKISCDEGYAFKDNLTEMDLKCEHQQWKPVNPKQNFDPICKRKTIIKFTKFDR